MNQPHRKKTTQRDTTGLYDVVNLLLIPFDMAVTALAISLTPVRDGMTAQSQNLPRIVLMAGWLLYLAVLLYAMWKQFPWAWAGSLVFFVKVLLFYGRLLLGEDPYRMTPFYVLALALHILTMVHILRRRDLFHGEGRLLGGLLRRYRSDEEIPTEYMQVVISFSRFINGATIALILGSVAYVFFQELTTGGDPFGAAGDHWRTLFPTIWALLRMVIALTLSFLMLWALGQRKPAAWYILMADTAWGLFQMAAALIVAPDSLSLGEDLIRLFIALAIGLYWYKRKCLFIPDGYTPPPSLPDSPPPAAETP